MSRKSHNQILLSYLHPDRISEPARETSIKKPKDSPETLTSFCRIKSSTELIKTCIYLAIYRSGTLLYLSQAFGT